MRRFVLVALAATLLIGTSAISLTGAPSAASTPGLVTLAGSSHGRVTGHHHTLQRAPAHGTTCQAAAFHSDTAPRPQSVWSFIKKLRKLLQRVRGWIDAILDHTSDGGGDNGGTIEGGRIGRADVAPLMPVAPTARTGLAVDRTATPETRTA